MKKLSFSERNTQRNCFLYERNCFLYARNCFLYARNCFLYARNCFLFLRRLFYSDLAIVNVTLHFSKLKPFMKELEKISPPLRSFFLLEASWHLSHLQTDCGTGTGSCSRSTTGLFSSVLSFLLLFSSSSRGTKDSDPLPSVRTPPVSMSALRFKSGLDASMYSLHIFPDFHPNLLFNCCSVAPASAS